ncbi:Sirohydrochlorin cobaltochelatase [Posidoniimonas polymericola]|uniref:Sirohydrochlorin cobaltochelatase n=1 Tax=Posidoniimonas polymericola TaxID=2528002 RepID=A0A5C5XSW0_9BACT|nr:CbiX/SirB N-terminal domain-containing protein [Posidoniimonas polymericola]TWT66327.1 Sirohydrochlorin cobaltochelatase [Posidoniimonas polymericola]
MTSDPAPQHAARRLADLLQQSGAAEPIGVIIVDHGSRRPESNDLLLEVVASFSGQTGVELVEPAHMELAEPSIADAFARLVARGAKRVIVAPFFLAPGRHWNEDIPELTRAAAAQQGGTPFAIAEPMGQHPAMAEVLASRIAGVLGQVDASGRLP